MDVHANWRMPARAFFTSNIDEVNLDLAWIFSWDALGLRTLKPIYTHGRNCATEFTVDTL